MTLIGSLRRLFTYQDKKIFIGLLLLAVIVSLFETAGISVLMVFITMATNFEVINTNPYFYRIYALGGFSHPANFVIAVGIALIFFYFFRAALNIALTYGLSSFAQMRQHRFATEIFERFLLLEYKDFTQRSAATFSQVIFGFTGNATQVINGMLNIVSESFTILAIYSMLFYVNWKMTLVLTLFLTSKVFLLIKAFSGKITRAGKQSQIFSVGMSKLFNETFGNYKFLKLLSNMSPTVKKFKDLNFNFARANSLNSMWQGFPRFILETMGFSILISVIVYVLFRYRNAQFVIPIVSMYALAFYRFLPSVNKILIGYNQIIFNQHALQPLSQYLHLPREEAGAKTPSFKKSLELKNVRFGYNPAKPVIHSANLLIKPGEKIGFVGESGAGKSTIIDILVGLLPPDQGEIFIDGELLGTSNVSGWRRLIGYIPQQVYLFDGTVAENIVCGRERDEARLVSVLKQTNMYDFLMGKEGLHTRVGEGGIQLSGGQRQRLAIARALYGNPPILVLDEATSSLDNENEEFVMNEMYKAGEGRTMLVIAHRLSTIARCDRVFEIREGCVYEIPLTIVLGEKPLLVENIPSGLIGG